MKISRSSLGLVVGVVVFVTAFVWFLTTRGPLAPVGVESGSVSRADLVPTVYGIGTIEAQHAYVVGPIQAGRVLRVLVDHGDAVRAGQLLAEIDPVDLGQREAAARNGAARAREGARAALAQVAEAESRAKLAQANSDRYQTLAHEKFIAKEMADSRHHEAAAAGSALAAARANAAGAQRDIQRAEAELQAIAQMRSSLRLLSPVDGVVTAREAEPGATVVSGQAVVRLVDPSRLWVRARIEQSRAQHVQPGQPATIELRSMTGNAMPGRVARIDLQSDAVTEERIVQVAFDAAPGPLYLGELAEVEIRLPGARNALTIPRAAIVRQEQQVGVWQAVDGRARFKPIQLGAHSADRVQVVSGLAEGERLIVYSAKQLEGGTRVSEQKLSSQ